MNAFALQSQEYPFVEGLFRFFRRRPTSEKPVLIKIKNHRLSFEVIIRSNTSLSIDEISFYMRDGKLFVTGVIPESSRTFTLNPQRAFTEMVAFPQAVDEASLEASYSVDSLFIVLTKKK